MTDVLAPGPHAARRDGVLLSAALVTFAFWLAAVGPARSWAAHAGLRAHWTVSVAPSFFAGLTFALWQAFATHSRPLAAVALAAALVTLAEAAQLALPRYTADLWDVCAGVVGAALALPFLHARAHRALGRRPQ